MKKTLQSLLIAFILALPFQSFTQISFDEDQLGGWYMYFWNTSFNESGFGLQGDVQYRNWNVVGDLEQLLLRGGLTYSPKKSDVTFTAGYGFISTGQFGDSKETSQESRIYQEVLVPNKVGERFYLKHRYRFEQRFVENQVFRTRFRYNLFVTVPLNQTSLSEGAIYLALYNELFINGQRELGTFNFVNFFDRNRFYVAAGYSIKDNAKVQLGVMAQKTDNWTKNQVQLSLHHSF
jgi:hypothetical protein